MTSLVDAESVLAIDIGSLNTRALLFDLVDGQYHFVAAGVGPTTAGLPFRDISEGVHIALQRLQEITGRTLTGTEGSLIIPSQSRPRSRTSASASRPTRPPGARSCRTPRASTTSPGG